MLSILAITVPIFALILVGWGARRKGIFGPATSGELNRFVVNLALPALLFQIVAKVRWQEIWQPGFIGAFGIGAFSVFAITVALRVRRSRHLADAAIDGLNAAYANTAYIGFPLALSALGPAGLTAPLIASILTVCLLFALGLILIEVGLQQEAHPLHMAAKVGRALARNPLLVAPVLGAVWLATGIPLPDSADHFLKLLGGAASPCALVGLGAFLAERRPAGRGEGASVAVLCLAKLIAQPLLTWVLATRIFHLAPETTRAAVLLATLPTGTGPFMVAEYHGREATITARTILITTLLSLVTITVCLALLP
ncbi:AEC family transporter [Novosphingobium pituita]|jgi:predicted permease|uniref:AEC family transporter n=1 Tax=Novosphingobium pituita TaxID=3056842 RepID=A0ABQ6P660_9SPHN|nr:AEC family transporter [Novosphingobium sp. IK01]MDK4805103.1 AEC family transporter [Novosphingobium aromaticivorans]GMM60397.1 AEC family transporter [Novosphingobium sp. IK01]HIQ18318.1 AEC family transporter [Novosphingobium capsulatum]